MNRTSAHEEARRRELWAERDQRLTDAQAIRLLAAELGFSGGNTLSRWLERRRLRLVRREWPRKPRTRTSKKVNPPTMYEGESIHTLAEVWGESLSFLWRARLLSMAEDGGVWTLSRFRDRFGIRPQSAGTLWRRMRRRLEGLVGLEGLDVTRRERGRVEVRIDSLEVVRCLLEGVLVIPIHDEDEDE